MCELVGVGQTHHLPDLGSTNKGHSKAYLKDKPLLNGVHRIINGVGENLAIELGLFRVVSESSVVHLEPALELLLRNAPVGEAQRAQPIFTPRAQVL